MVILLGAWITVEAAVDYTIIDYDGELVIHSDNTADYTQTITYEFDSSFNGVYITLGDFGKMPNNFRIDRTVDVTVTEDGYQYPTKQMFTESIPGGYQVSIY